MSGPGVDPAAPRLGVPVIRVDELESTNDLARVCAAVGVPEGAVVIARRQTRGRGRYGRVWVSPTGGLWCSVLLRPAPRSGWGRLSLAMAVATAEAIDQTADVRSAIRWPNDVLVGGKKVAGVLLEAAADAVVVGIGINANIGAEALPHDLRLTAVSLHDAAGRAIALEPLLDALLARGGYWYGAWAQGGPEVIAAWTARDATRGRRVVVESRGATVEGIGEGVDDDGALCVRLAGGEVRRVLAGDLIAAPRADHEDFVP